MKLSVNILNWNCVDTLKLSLPMLKEELNGMEYEIIVVDNGSTDESREYLVEQMMIWRGRRLKVIWNNENYGISVGKNMGFDNSAGDYLLLLDADVLPVKNSIKLMVKFLDDNSHCSALGAYPNKWSNQLNTESIKYHEEYCNVLFDPKEHNAACLFYGIYRRELFDNGLKLRIDGEFGKVGYGWEDHDFYMRLNKMGHKQYVAHINSPTGKYYHAINSSIRQMGHDKYMESSRERGKLFKELWR